MSLATPLGKVASKLMTRFGGVVTLRRVTPGVYNPTTGIVSETTTDTVIRGVLEDVNLQEANDLIQAGDKRLIVAAIDVPAPPTMADKVLIGSRLLQVVQLRVVEQDNTPITYELTLRD